MGLDRVHLRNLLHLMMLSEKARASEIRKDARLIMKRQDEGPSPGNDFYLAFWSSAKKHAAGKEDLVDAVDHQIAKNWRRKNLYPLLRDGFLGWWNEKRRWINEDIKELPRSIKSVLGFFDLEGRVKVENLLCLQIGGDSFRYVYPYFKAAPALDAETARLGLWVMSKALSDYDIRDMRILDVVRGETFSVDRYPFVGDEEEIVTLRYRRMLREWREHFR